MIDHFWVNKFLSSKSGIINLDFTDHSPCFSHFYLQQDTNRNSEKKKIHFRHHSSENLVNFQNKISAVDWGSITSGGDLEECWAKFMKELNFHYCKSFPVKTKVLSTNTFSKPWLTKNIRNLIKQKSQYFTLYKQGIISRACNNSFKNNVNNIIQNAKRNHYNTFFSNNSVSPRKKWSKINNLMGNSRKQNSFDSLKFDDEIVPPHDIPDKLNQFFVNIPLDLDRKLATPSVTPLSFLKNFNSHSMFLFPVSDTECSKIIGKLKNTKSGLDSIPVTIFKIISPQILEFLVKLINRSFNFGYFPKIFKIARITPIFKGGDAGDPGNYRPIASLPFISKIFERLLYNRIIDFSCKYKLLSDSQFGFRSNLSTLDSLVSLTESIYETLNDKSHHISVFLDLKKAFDTVNYPRQQRKHRDNIDTISLARVNVVKSSSNIVLMSS